MEFKEKWDEIVKLMFTENSDLYDEDDEDYRKMYAIGQRLPLYIDNWPYLAIVDGNEIDIEDLDIENIEIQLFDNYAHIHAGGDWQAGASFDIVLNPHSFSDKPFMAVNIVVCSDIKGNDIRDGIWQNED